VTAVTAATQTLATGSAATPTPVMVTVATYTDSGRAGRGRDLKQVDLHSLDQGFFLIWINAVMESSAQYCEMGLTNTEP